MTMRLFSSVIFLAMAVGCTEQTTGGTSDQVHAEENDGPSLKIKPDGDVQAPTENASPADPAEDTPSVEVTQTKEGVSISGKRQVFMGGFRRKEQEVDPEMVEYQLSRLGPVELKLSDLPPTADPLEPGRYLLSIVIQLTSGSFNKDQWPCRVEVDGPTVRILLENRRTDPILATFEDGSFFSEPREGGGTYGLEGQMVGPGKLRGVVIPGPEEHPRVGIVEGRWGLDSLPLADPLPSGREERAK